MQYGLEKKEDANPDITLTTWPTLTSHSLRAWQTQRLLLPTWIFLGRELFPTQMK